ncbi:endolytic transglycosylase MltG [Streptomyces purpureus]|uniref:endolytic transglycosylase MltG n=1 Tax=Streptomyces purpureus TaxID=1951 RepID=UPI00036D6290|nr:endolytic transglycosylase MltG [Streptomyces purpureus]
MTEYGRSPGSEPWHPEDPLFGDQGWRGQQAGGQQQYYQQSAPQQSQPQSAQYGTSQEVYGQSYGGQQQYTDPQYTDPQYADPQYGGQTYDTSGFPGQQYDGGWETGQQAAMPYAAPAPDPYADGQGPDLYGTPEAYPPPQPPARRPAEPEPQTDWDAQAQEEEKHPFFTGDGADDGDGRDDEPGSRSSRGGGRDRRGKGKGKKKSKNGIACLVVAAVLVGGVGGVAYFGYQFWQGQFGAAPDFVGEGSGSVEVEIPKGAGGYDIGNILKKAGVVKSVDAFVSAQAQNPKGSSIQDGVYTLKKGMSAARAVDLMLNPASRANFIIPEGKRNGWVYAEIDKRLALKKGTTEGVAKAQANELGLPDWAKGHKDVKDPLEGFLFPSSYPVAKGNKPEDVLRKMVARANDEYGKLDLEAKSKELGLKGPWELITVASLVQVEGKYKHDFDKVARVVYNRLKPNNVETVGRMEFDSTVNYIKNESTLDVGSVADLRRIKDPYNTYDIKGLTPGPISNPGLEAVKSAMNPTPGPWYYFVSINENKTVFSVTNEEHNQNVAEYEKERKKSGQ